MISKKLETSSTNFNPVLGDGIWETVDLVQSKDEPNLWLGQLPHQHGLTYFVQAVDKGGNVAIYDNKGRYISLPTLYLPLITSRP